MPFTDQLHLCVQIDVSYNNIDQAGSLELIAAMKGKSMASIGMARCELGLEGAKAMAELVSVTGSLTQVLAFSLESAIAIFCIILHSSIFALLVCHAA